MKVVDLVTHTSGLTYGFMNRTSVDRAYRRARVAEFNTEGGLDAMIEQLAKIPLEFSPGTAWNYSVSIDVMGYLVQKLSGMSFGEFLRTRLFEPLGMTDTAFWCPPEKVGRLASCYMPKEGGGIKTAGRCGREHLRRAARPGVRRRRHGVDRARLHALLPDDAAWRNAGRRADPQPQDRRAVQPQSPARQPGAGRHGAARPVQRGRLFGIGFSIGCGVNIDVAKTRLPGTLGEYFWGGAASTAFWIDPKEELAVVFMTQVIGSDARLTLRRDLRTLVYSAMTESFA